MTNTFHDDAWRSSMHHAMQAIVTIHTTLPRSFDNASKGCCQGTGTVVDTQFGFILTNRHMVSDGPMHARAVFQSGARQCPITPYHVDPIHDFAFCKYDVEQLQGLPLKAIHLRPELAKVGQEIRVLGNDMGRVMSILPGVISRVDCNPPRWDSWTNYIQASADTVAGSSGSPVMIEDGSAVALVSGSYQDASTDLYLPLDLPLRVLNALRLGQTIPRGTIQSTWAVEKPADCHARGLTYEEIQKHSPDGSGLLVAKEILPNGPSHSYVEEADILNTIDGQIVTSLSQFEQLIDGAVGNVIKVQVQRHGNKLEYELKVQDLWTLTPCRLLEYAGASFHDLRYHTAFFHNVPLEGVHLTDDEGSFVLDGSGDKIIRSLNNQSTPDLDAFIEVARGIPDQARIAVEYQILGDLTPLFQTITVDRHWLHEKMVLQSRNDDISSWNIKDFGPAPIMAPLPNQALPTKPIAECHPVVRKIMPKMVQVHVQTPYGTNGAYLQYIKCMGLVINATAGFVITARSFIPSTMCNLRIIFADSIEVPATKVYDHALGFTVVRYDTSLIKGSIGSVTFSTRVPKAQDKMTIFGPEIDGSGPCPMETTVTRIGPLTGEHGCDHFYHPINMEVLHFEKGRRGGVGVLLDADGDVQGLWLPFNVTRIEWVGVQFSWLMPAFEMLQKGTVPPECRMLDVELGTVHKNDVQAFGVSEEAGDIIVKRGKDYVTEMSDLRDMFTHESLEMSVIRHQIEVDLDVPTIPISRWQSDRVVWFAGAQLEPPYSPVPLCAGKLYSRIFVTHVRTGSPAEMYQLSRHHFVTQVNGVATVEFDDFTEKIKRLPDSQYCQLTLVSLRGVPKSVQLMPNRGDFKNTEACRMEKEPHNWQFQVLGTELKSLDGSGVRVLPII